MYVAFYLDARRKPCVRILPNFACTQDEFWNEVYITCRHIGRRGGRFINVGWLDTQAAANALVARSVSEGYEDMTNKLPWVSTPGRGIHIAGQ